MCLQRLEDFKTLCTDCYCSCPFRDRMALDNMWDPSRVLAERAFWEQTDVLVPIRRLPNIDTLFSLCMLFKALAQSEGPPTPATVALLSAIACPFLVPRGISLRKYGRLPKAVVEDGDLTRCLPWTYQSADRLLSLHKFDEDLQVL